MPLFYCADSAEKAVMHILGWMMDLSDWLAWETAKSLFNSNFMTSLFGALAGAWGGARAAQNIAKREKDRETLFNEIRHTNLAIETASNVLGTFANFREQHAIRLKKHYDEERARVIAWHEQHRGQPSTGEQLHVAPEISFVEPLFINFQQLENEVLRGTSVSGRARAMVAMIGQTLTALNKVIESRNEQIKGFLQTAGQHELHVQLIYGLPIPGMGVHRLFGDTIDAIDHYNEAATYFSYRLCRDLERYGDRMRLLHTRQFRQWAPSVTRVRFEDAESKGIIPSPEKYPTWERNYYERIPKTAGRKWGKAWFTLRSIGRILTSPFNRRFVAYQRFPNYG